MVLTVRRWLADHSARLGYAVLAAALVAGIWRLETTTHRAQHQLEAGRVANCRQIEEHKRFHREEAAFDLRETRDALRELGIDPYSDRGLLLLERIQRNARREQARFAAREC